jgi:hypothetical protein
MPRGFLDWPLMNAERLHAIGIELKQELQQTEAVPLMQQLLQGLQNMGQQPGQPGPEQTVSQVREQLRERLADAPSNHFSPAWRAGVKELGISDLVGEELMRQVEEIFDRNEITPSAAAAELEPIAARLSRLDNALDQLIQSFDFFNIGSEELEPGEFEIGFLIPREAVGDALEQLGYEFLKLKRIIGPFQELAIGAREDAEVRSISSSWFQVFLHSHAAVALMYAGALERLISAYEKVMNIRVAYKQLEESDVGKEALDAVEASAEGKMSEEIAAIVNDLVAKKEKEDKARANELRKELTDSLNALANRIDRGYSMEVRAGELPEPEPEDDETEEGAEEQLLREMVQQVRAMQGRLTFANLSGSPILELPESIDESEPATEDGRRPPNNAGTRIRPESGAAMALGDDCFRTQLGFAPTTALATFRCWSGS